MAAYAPFVDVLKMQSDGTKRRDRSLEIGVALGSGLGAALGLLFDHFVLWTVLGASIGTAVGEARRLRNRQRDT